MGLDAYLLQRVDVRRHNRSYVDKINVTLEIGGVLQSSCVTHFTTEAHHWRNAVYIHNWFITNGNVKQCQEVLVSRSLLKRLLGILTKICNTRNESLRAQLLSTHFQGCDNHHELKETRNALDKILSSSSRGININDFYYVYY